MEKSKHKYQNNQIPYEELKNFIEPVRMNINMSLREIYEFHGNGMEILIHDLNSKYEELLDKMPTFKKEVGNSYPFGSVSYTPHKNGYDFRFNPVDIINDIFRNLKINVVLQYIDLDNPEETEYFIDRVNNILETEKAKRISELRLQKIYEVQNNINEILKMYNYDINNEIKEHSSPKTVLFYLAYKSLIEYERTHNEAYLVLPYEYYNYVSSRSYIPYPFHINVRGRIAKRGPRDFNCEYNNIAGFGYIPNITQINNNLKTSIIGWKILPPGHLEKKYREAYEIIRDSNPELREKYLRLFEMKTNYFTSSPVKSRIAGLYGLKGYVGFAYPNENLIFDKFFNSDTMSEEYATILSHPEAIYTLPADELPLIRYNKQDIKRFIDSNNHQIYKINHTENGSFIGRLDKVVKAPKTSSLTFEEAIENESKNILIKGK